MISELQVHQATMLVARQGALETTSFILLLLSDILTCFIRLSTSEGINSLILTLRAKSLLKTLILLGIQLFTTDETGNRRFSTIPGIASLS